MVPARQRRPRRAQRRALWWVEQILAVGEADGGGRRALDLSWQWLRAELSGVSELRPQAAEAARWDLARQLSAYAALLARAKIPLRAGLTQDEVSALLGQQPPKGDRP